MQILQDARTTVQRLPPAMTYERISALLSDAWLLGHRLTRTSTDEIRESALPGSRSLFMSLQADDLPLEFGSAWTGSAELVLEHSDINHAPFLKILVDGNSGLQSELNASHTARVAWRVGDALAQAFADAERSDPLQPDA